MTERHSPESTRRRGMPGSDTLLADGRMWGLASPCVRLRPSFVTGVDESGRRTVKVEAVADSRLPKRIRDLIARLNASAEEGTIEELYEAFFAAASALLMAAHDIDLATATSLLEVSDDALPGLVAAVLSALSGEVDGIATA